MGAHQPQRAAVAGALDFRNDVDPPRLAVARPHDPVGRGIILVAAFEGIEELLDGALAVVGMDPVDPVLMGFVGRIRRQPVNDEIFRRAAVLETVAEVDLDTADSTDALDPRQFRFAFLQRAMRPVAFACDLLQMLPQSFGGFNFGQDVRRFGRGHTRRQPLPALSHTRW